MKAKGFAGLTAMLAVLVVLLVARWPATQAQSVASITLPEPGSTKLLYPGCNNITLTFPEGTSSTTVVEAVTPRDSVKTMWRYSAAEQRWEGFSSAATGAKDLLTVNFLDAVWICVVSTLSVPTGTPSTATVTPVSATTTPTPSATATATPAATATPSSPTPTPVSTGTATPAASETVNRAVVPLDALSSYRYTMRTSSNLGQGLMLSWSASGAFEAPDRLSCDVTVSAMGFSFTTRYVVIGDQVWMNTGGGWVPATLADAAPDLAFCPGSRLFWETFEWPGDLGGIQGVPTTVNGVAAVRVSLSGLVQRLPLLGVGVAIAEGVIVHSFDVWVAQDGDWVVRLQFDAEVSDQGGSLPVQMLVDVTQPNDATITVEPPS